MSSPPSARQPRPARSATERSSSRRSKRRSASAPVSGTRTQSSRLVAVQSVSDGPPAKQNVQRGENGGDPVLPFVFGRSPFVFLRPTAELQSAAWRVIRG